MELEEYQDLPEEKRSKIAATYEPKQKVIEIARSEIGIMARAISSLDKGGMVEEVALAQLAESLVFVKRWAVHEARHFIQQMNDEDAFLSARGGTGDYLDDDNWDSYHNSEGEGQARKEEEEFLQREKSRLEGIVESRGEEDFKGVLAKRQLAIIGTTTREVEEDIDG